MVGRWARILRHLMTPDWVARRHFPPDVLDAIELAIVESEKLHRGEIRFAVETEIELGALLQGVTPRQRALEAFGHLGVWDTEENSGVLIFVQLVDRRVEIVADRGVAQFVSESELRAISAQMECAFASAEYASASSAAIKSIGSLLQQHFPAFPRNPNELPDRPVLI